ncbi:unnamed protein product [Pleuronectes platessa]|uniref:Uncharacterized protein n=1 Tax=Pleuronectes platessa TaxID=8262 RepID=A0A9N7V3D7_PLEPL|nr:unnamed protein product [Pleuronectes platessa]
MEQYDPNHLKTGLVTVREASFSKPGSEVRRGDKTALGPSNTSTEWLSLATDKADEWLFTEHTPPLSLASIPSNLPVHKTAKGPRTDKTSVITANSGTDSGPCRLDVGPGPLSYGLWTMSGTGRPTQGLGRGGVLGSKRLGFSKTPE